MSNMGFKSESTGNEYKKVEKMRNYFSDDTGAFPKLNNMEKMTSRVQVGRIWQEVSLFSVPGFE